MLATEWKSGASARIEWPTYDLLQTAELVVGRGSVFVCLAKVLHVCSSLAANGFHPRLSCYFFWAEDQDLPVTVGMC